MKVIFLDIDGVLSTHKQCLMNHNKFMDKNPWAKKLKVPYPFDKDCVNVFNKILTETDAEIVVSSDWRKYWSLDELSEIFHNNGCVKYPIDKTPIQVNTFNYDKNRVMEIESYIHEKNIENFVIIDDLPLNLYLSTGKYKFIKTRETEGLKQTGIYNKIVKLFDF